MAKDKVFSKAQEAQIKKAFKAMNKDLGIDKLDDKKALERIFNKVKKPQSSSGSRGGVGGGGMNPIDLEKVPGRRPLKMAKGGKVRSSCDGIAKKGKTKGRMV